MCRTLPVVQVFRALSTILRNLHVNINFCCVVCNRTHILIAYYTKLQQLLTNISTTERKQDMKL
jgi:hypothetical protein